MSAVASGRSKTGSMPASTRCGGSFPAADRRRARILSVCYLQSTAYTQAVDYTCVIGAQLLNDWQEQRRLRGFAFPEPDHCDGGCVTGGHVGRISTQTKTDKTPQYELVIWLGGPGFEPRLT